MLISFGNVTAAIARVLCWEAHYTQIPSLKVAEKEDFLCQVWLLLIITAL